MSRGQEPVPAAIAWLIDNPLVTRQGRVQLRSRRAVLTVVLYPCALAGAGVLALATRGAGPATEHARRQAVFLPVALQLGLVLVLGPSLAAGAIAGERQGRTFDLLVLSRLSSVQIVYGKLVGSLLYLVPLIVASVPLVLAMFAYEQLGLGQVLWVELLTVVTAVAAASMAILVSAVIPRVVPATAGALALVLAVYAATALPAVSPNPFSALHLLVAAPYGTRTGGWQRPWSSALAQSVLAVGSLTAAVVVIRRPAPSNRHG
jgi:hypothetical protein